MRIPRVILKSAPLSDSTPIPFEILISGAEAHHLIHVLRLKSSDQVEIILPNSSLVYRAIIQSIDIDEQIKALVQEQLTAPSLPALTVVCGLTKSDTAEFIAEKATELGIARLCFFEADRTQGRLSQEQKKKKLDRLYRIRDSALKQSGPQAIPTQIELFSNLASCLSELEDSTPNNKRAYRLLCATSSDASSAALSLLDVLTCNSTIPAKSNNTQELLEYPPCSADNYLIIGPEGGLTQEEYDLGIKHEFEPVSLGPKVLRTETAVIAASALVIMLGR